MKGKGHFNKRKS